jgi:quercetin dioxygenase-like cupin family protein
MNFPRIYTDIEPVTGIFTFSVSAGTEVPMHNAPQPCIRIVLSGEGEVTTSDGATLRRRHTSVRHERPAQATP